MSDFEVIAEGLGFTEGPVQLPDGRLVVTSVSLGKLFVLRGRQVESAIETGGGPNGLTCDAEGTVYVAQNGGILPNQPKVPAGIQRVADGKVEYVVAGLDAPNDLCFGPDGRLYFTDSRGYPSDPANHPPGRVFALDLASGMLTMLLEGPRFANGIAFGPDDALYIAETFGARILRYRLEGDRLRADGVLCALVNDGHPDGMCFDADGNLWSTSTGAGQIQVYDPSGRFLRALDCGEGAIPTNCCFGGPDNRTLFVTAAGKGRVIAFRTEARGLPLYPFR